MLYNRIDMISVDMVLPSVKSRFLRMPHTENLVKIVLLSSLFLLIFVCISPTQQAMAVPTVNFDVSLYTTGDVAVITVNDPAANTNPTSLDTVTVTVTSTTDPTGILVTLTETGVNTGIFKNTILVFTTGNTQYSSGNTIVVSINDTTLNTDPSTIQTVNTRVDSFFPNLAADSTINPFTLTETGPNTGIFQAKLTLTSGTTSTSSIHVTSSDILSVTNLVSGKATNAVIIPTQTGVNSISSTIGDTITASYSGAAPATSTIIAGIGGGGGGGGLIRPGLVLDIIVGIIGGSPYVVQPPSFGGLGYHFSDGLTFTQANNKTIHDISHYNQELPRQVMVLGDKVNMTFKTYESYNSEGVIHMGLYLIPRGHDMITPKSIASIEWNKGKPVTIADPNHILSNVNASSISDGKFQYTQFVFTPTKSYDKMSFLVRAWNDHRYSTDTRIHDAIDIPQIINSTLPQGTIKYDNLSDLQQALHKDQFYKPEILSHIHDTSAVFTSQPGKIYWLYDTVNHFVTLVIVDENNNELFSQKSPLQPYDIEKKGDYKFMYFTVKQLDRWDTDQMQKALKSEEEKALSVGIEKRIIPQSKW